MHRFTFLCRDITAPHILWGRHLSLQQYWRAQHGTLLGSSLPTTTVVCSLTVRNWGAFIPNRPRLLMNSGWKHNTNACQLPSGKVLFMFGWMLLISGTSFLWKRCIGFLWTKLSLLTIKMLKSLRGGKCFGYQTPSVLPGDRILSHLLLPKEHPDFPGLLLELWGLTYQTNKSTWFFEGYFS